ncbi:hypothetical protein VOLCADRAFT_91830 [Volvox carteri f. nagariensis]|uniref:Uncharacterized protein n=1 Tax=Volvox carteri f. nagariensis TaxID=3068 RepID=D8TY25_VOLCA|nr:uncharacterized protein VOLCADRAFT_91830 [Volvox carteri f. nagariensis]EFJ47570.1 hypothetical protein VOLCADRAFT_91830 [Volvox carteri f. nagariensis]|eukprot:XP_002951394.1 hypothetical protein VOLCADRAFT_91830 [Volvox carteri f. nagariensis]
MDLKAQQERHWHKVNVAAALAQSSSVGTGSGARQAESLATMLPYLLLGTRHTSRQATSGSTQNKSSSFSSTGGIPPCHFALLAPGSLKASVLNARDIMSWRRQRRALAGRAPIPGEAQQQQDAVNFALLEKTHYSQRQLTSDNHPLSSFPRPAWVSEPSSTSQLKPATAAGPRFAPPASPPGLSSKAVIGGLTAQSSSAAVAGTAAAAAPTAPSETTTDHNKGLWKRLSSKPQPDGLGIAAADFLNVPPSTLAQTLDISRAIQETRMLIYDVQQLAKADRVLRHYFLMAERALGGAQDPIKSPIWLSFVIEDVMRRKPSCYLRSADWEGCKTMFRELSDTALVRDSCWVKRVCEALGLEAGRGHGNLLAALPPMWRRFVEIGQAEAVAAAVGGVLALRAAQTDDSSKATLLRQPYLLRTPPGVRQVQSQPKLDELEPLACAALYAVVQLLKAQDAKGNAVTALIVRPHDLYDFLSLVEPPASPLSAHYALGSSNPRHGAPQGGVMPYSQHHLIHVATAWRQDRQGVAFKAYAVRTEIIAEAGRTGQPCLTPYGAKLLNSSALYSTKSLAASGGMPFGFGLGLRPPPPSAAPTGPLSATSVPFATERGAAARRAFGLGPRDAAECGVTKTSVAASEAAAPAVASHRLGGRLSQSRTAHDSPQSASMLAGTYTEWHGGSSSDDGDRSEDDYSNLGRRNRNHQNRNGNSDSGGDSDATTVVLGSPQRTYGPGLPYVPYKPGDAATANLTCRGEGRRRRRRRLLAGSSVTGGEGGELSLARQAARATSMAVCWLQSLGVVDPDLERMITADFASCRTVPAAASSTILTPPPQSPSAWDRQLALTNAPATQSSGTMVVTSSAVCSRQPCLARELKALADRAAASVLLPPYGDNDPDNRTARLPCLWLEDGEKNSTSMSSSSTSAASAAGAGPGRCREGSPFGRPASLPAGPAPTTAILSDEVSAFEQREKSRAGQLRAAFLTTLRSDAALRRLVAAVLPRTRHRDGVASDDDENTTAAATTDSDVKLELEGEEVEYAEYTEDDEQTVDASSKAGDGAEGAVGADRVGGRVGGGWDFAARSRVTEEQVLSVEDIGELLRRLRPGLQEAHPRSWAALEQEAREEEERLGSTISQNTLASKMLRLGLLGLTLLAHRPDLPLRLLRLLPCVAAGATYREWAMYSRPPPGAKMRGVLAAGPCPMAHYHALIAFAAFNFLPGRLHSAAGTAATAVTGVGSSLRFPDPTPAGAATAATAANNSVDLTAKALARMLRRNQTVWESIALYVSVQALAEDEGLAVPWLIAAGAADPEEAPSAAAAAAATSSSTGCAVVGSSTSPSPLSAAAAGLGASQLGNLAELLRELKRDVVVAAAMNDPLEESASSVSSASSSSASEARGEGGEMAGGKRIDGGGACGGGGGGLASEFSDSEDRWFIEAPQVPSSGSGSTESVAELEVATEVEAEATEGEVELEVTSGDGDEAAAGRLADNSAAKAVVAAAVTVTAPSADMRPAAEASHSDPLPPPPPPQAAPSQLSSSQLRAGGGVVPGTHGPLSSSNLWVEAGHQIAAARTDDPYGCPWRPSAPPASSSSNSAKNTAINSSSSNIINGGSTAGQGAMTATAQSPAQAAKQKPGAATLPAEYWQPGGRGGGGAGRGGGRSKAGTGGGGGGDGGCSSGISGLGWLGGPECQAVAADLDDHFLKDPSFHKMMLSSLVQNLAEEFEEGLLRSVVDACRGTPAPTSAPAPTVTKCPTSVPLGREGSGAAPFTAAGGAEHGMGCKAAAAAEEEDARMGPGGLARSLRGKEIEEVEAAEALLLQQLNLNPWKEQSLRIASWPQAPDPSAASGRCQRSGGGGGGGGMEGRRKQLGGPDWEPQQALPVMLRLWRCAADRADCEAKAACGVRSTRSGTTEPRVVRQHVTTVGGPGLMLALTAMYCGDEQRAAQLRRPANASATTAATAAATASKLAMAAAAAAGSRRGPYSTTLATSTLAGTSCGAGEERRRVCFQPSASVRTSQLALGLLGHGRSAPEQQTVFPPPEGVPGVVLLAITPDVVPEQRVERRTMKSVAAAAVRDCAPVAGVGSGCGGAALACWLWMALMDAATLQGGLFGALREGMTGWENAEGVGEVARYDIAAAIARTSLVSERSGALRVQALGLEGLETAVLLLSQVRMEMQKQQRDLVVVVRQLDHQGIAAAGEDEVDERPLASRLYDVDRGNDEQADSYRCTNSNSNSNNQRKHSSSITSGDGAGGNSAADTPLELLHRYNSCFQVFWCLLPALDEALRSLFRGGVELEVEAALEQLEGKAASTAAEGGSSGGSSGADSSKWRANAQVAERLRMALEDAHGLMQSSCAVQKGLVTELVVFECEIGRPERLVVQRRRGGNSSEEGAAAAVSAAAKLESSTDCKGIVATTTAAAAGMRGGRKGKGGDASAAGGRAGPSGGRGGAGLLKNGGPAPRRRYASKRFKHEDSDAKDEEDEDRGGTQGKYGCKQGTAVEDVGRLLTVGQRVAFVGGTCRGGYLLKRKLPLIVKWLLLL